MNHELALELKNAGFPPPKVNGNFAIDTKTLETIPIPTLTELLDACGFDFRDLSLHTPRPATSTRQWIAKGGKRVFGKWRLVSGHSPEEAVAKLWLSLRGKSVVE